MTGDQRTAARMRNLASRMLACAAAGDRAGAAAARAQVRPGREQALFDVAVRDARAADAAKRPARLEAERRHAEAVAAYRRSVAEWRAEHQATVARLTADLEARAMPDLAEVIQVVAEYVQAAEARRRWHTGRPPADGHLAA